MNIDVGFFGYSKRLTKGDMGLSRHEYGEGDFQPIHKWQNWAEALNQLFNTENKTFPTRQSFHKRHSKHVGATGDVDCDRPLP